jgi:hypothetical protein
MACRVFEGFAQSLIRFANAEFRDKSLKKNLIEVFYKPRAKKLWREDPACRDFEIVKGYQKILIRRPATITAGNRAHAHSIKICDEVESII